MKKILKYWALIGPLLGFASGAGWQYRERMNEKAEQALEGRARDEQMQEAQATAERLRQELNLQTAVMAVYMSRASIAASNFGLAGDHLRSAQDKLKEVLAKAPIGKQPALTDFIARLGTAAQVIATGNAEAAGETLDVLIRTIDTQGLAKL